MSWESVKPFVTNIDKPIFGLRNLPEVVKGALFARYSRSDKDLRTMLVEEFLCQQESGLDGWVPPDIDIEQAINKASAFYDRVLLGFGDDSVAELGGAHIACEGISNIAAKALEDSRIGLSPLEKSSRYVDWGRKVNGQYQYVVPPEIASSPYAQGYRDVMDKLFRTYVELQEPLTEWVRKQYPQDEHTSDRAYTSVTRAKVLDLLRGLLPLSAQTNVGLFGNGRAFEYLLVKLYAMPHKELHVLADSIKEELDKLIPSFVKRVHTDKGIEHSSYIRNRYDRIKAIAYIPDKVSDVGVELVDYDPQAYGKVAAALLYPHLNVPIDDILDATLSEQDDYSDLFELHLQDRANRHMRPGRAFEEVNYLFDITADIGAYRDIQRHRMATQERQEFGVLHGYRIPLEVSVAGYAWPYMEALDAAGNLVSNMKRDGYAAAEYAVPFAYLVRWRLRMNLREAFHFCELRTGKQGHPSYRRIAQDIFRHIESVHPLLAQHMKYVDMEETSLERLESEQRIDRKLRT